jgi:hypothetical protein
MRLGLKPGKWLNQYEGVVEPVRLRSRLLISTTSHQVYHGSQSGAGGSGTGGAAAGVSGPLRAFMERLSPKRTWHKGWAPLIRGPFHNCRAWRSPVYVRLRPRLKYQMAAAITTTSRMTHQ